jgi:hypothetical protein
MWRWVTTDDGQRLKDVRSISCSFEPDGSRRIEVVIHEPATVDKITMRTMVVDKMEVRP